MKRLLVDYGEVRPDVLHGRAVAGEVDLSVNKNGVIHRRFIYKEHTSTHAEGADTGGGFSKRTVGVNPTVQQVNSRYDRMCCTVALLPAR